MIPRSVGAILARPRPEVHPGGAFCSERNEIGLTSSFERDHGERIDRATVLQGEIGGVGATHVANLRSWNACMDSLDVLTYAHWIE